MKKTQGSQKKAQEGIVNSLVYLSQEAIRNGQTELHDAIQSVVDAIFSDSNTEDGDRKKIVEFFQRYRKLSPQAQQSMLVLIDMFDDKNESNLALPGGFTKNITKH